MHRARTKIKKIKRTNILPRLVSMEEWKFGSRNFRTRNRRTAHTHFELIKTERQIRVMNKHLKKKTFKELTHLKYARLLY